MEAPSQMRTERVIPWQESYPPPKATPASISKEQLLTMMLHGASPGKDFLLVDLRRNDHEGGTIAGSINLPAQSLYPTIPTLYNLVESASIPRVIWYCGSSRGRGKRAAGWFADYLNEQGATGVESLWLEDGIAGWTHAGKDFVEKMHEYDASKWTPS